jgi:hypothetical protein
MGKTIAEKPREIPVLAEVDVLIVGSGPSGLSAAIASARAGANTMLIERFGFFGGVVTQCNMESVGWYRHERTVEAGGLLYEYERRSRNTGGSSPESQSTSQALNTEMFKCLADQMILEAGVRPLLHTFVVDSIVEDNAIKGVVCEGKSGRFAVLAKRIIDCTGDADVAARAGVPFDLFPPEDRAGVSPGFNVRGVDTKRFLKYVYEELRPTYSHWKKYWGHRTKDGAADDYFSPIVFEPFLKNAEDHFIEVPKNIHIGGTYSTVTPEGEVTMLNMVFLQGIDCLNVEDLTKAEITSREYVLKVIRILNKYLPGFESARLRNLYSSLGTRESRLIHGKYRLTVHDIEAEARFEDSIAACPQFFDGGKLLNLPLEGGYFHMPYRALVPVNIDNLLVAGRCISGEKSAHWAVRNCVFCIATGQGAGVAAAVSLRDNSATSKVNIKAVQEELQRQNVRVF